MNHETLPEEAQDCEGGAMTLLDWVFQDLIHFFGSWIFFATFIAGVAIIIESSRR